MICISYNISSSYDLVLEKIWRIITKKYMNNFMKT